MNPGSERALYLLPFDHRHSYVDGLFGFKPPLSASQREEAMDSMSTTAKNRSFLTVSSAFLRLDD